MNFSSVTKSATLNDLQWRNNSQDPGGCSPSVWAIINSEIISQCATCILLCDNCVMMFIDELLVSKFVFYVVLFELMVK